MSRTARLVPMRTDASYGITGDAEGASWTEAEAKLAASRNYWVSTTRANGAPHAKPIWGLWHDGALWFGSGGVAGRNLQRDPRISVHLESGDDVVILEGTVELRSISQEVLGAYAEKYSMTAEEIGGGTDEGDEWFYLEPQVAFTWLEANFPKSASRWEFE